MIDRHPDLDELLDGRLTAEERGRAEEHLARCVRCRAEWDRLRMVRELLRGASEEQTLPEDLPRRVAALLDREEQRSPWRRRLAVTAAVAAAAVVIVAVIILRRPLPDLPSAAVDDLARGAART